MLTGYQKSAAEYAQLYGVSERSIKRYAAKGYPLDHPDEMGLRLGKQKNQPASAKAAPKVDTVLGGVMPGSKEEKLALECEKLRIENAIKQGRYTSNAIIQKDMARIATGVRASLMRMANDLAPLVAGKDEAGARIPIQAAVDKVIASLGNSLSALYQEPPEESEEDMDEVSAV